MKTAAAMRAQIVGFYEFRADERRTKLARKLKGWERKPGPKRSKRVKE